MQKTAHNASRGLCRVGLNRYLIDSMERETGIEPATSSLGSCCLDSAQRKINCLEWVVYGQMRHYRRVLNTISNTSSR